jgi:hypothetical protein
MLYRWLKFQLCFESKGSLIKTGVAGLNGQPMNPGVTWSAQDKGYSTPTHSHDHPTLERRRRRRRRRRSVNADTDY